MLFRSQGRVVVTVAPRSRRAFEKVMKGRACAAIGTVHENDRFVVRGRDGRSLIDTGVMEMLGSYRSRFEGY